MRVRRIAVIAAVLLLLVSISPVAGEDKLAAARARQRAIAGQIADQKARIAKLRTQQASLRDTIAATARELESVNADLGAVKQTLATVTDQYTEARERYKGLLDDIKALEAEIADLEAQETAKREEFAKRQSLLADRLQASYEQSRISLVEVILLGRTLDEAVAAASYYLDYAASDKALADSLNDDAETLKSLGEAASAAREQTIVLRDAAKEAKDALAERKSELAALKKRLASLSAQKASALSSQKSAFSQLQLSEEEAKKLLEQYEKAQDQLEAQIRRLIRERMRGGGIPSQYSGTLMWPMAGYVSQEYGCTGFGYEPRVGSCAHFHKGIDIAGPMYTPIKAAGAGRVIMAGPNPYDPYPKAWIVVIAHSSRLVTWYGHLDNGSHRPTVSPGDWVEKGEIIGYNGMTGRTTGPHLHWMVEFDDSFRNPRLFL